MARGHKDYGEGGQAYIIHPVTDLGEAVVRLGSPDVFQRSGNVVFITGFENGIADMVQALQGAGSAIDYMGDRSYSGGASVRLTGGSDVGRRARLTKRFHTVETTRMGLEATFSLEADCEYFALSAVVRDGTKSWNYTIYANMKDGKFQYFNSDGDKIDLDTFDWGNDDLDHWHTMKMVIDLENHEYGQVFYNEVSYDLVGIEPYSDTTADVPRLDFTGWIFSKDGKNGIVYLDNFIITINEP